MEFEKVKRRFDAMKEYADSYKTEWQDIAQYLAPSKGHFKDEPPKHNEIDYKTFINSTAFQALDTLSSGLQAGVTSPNRSWFSFFVRDKQDTPIAERNTVTESDKYLSLCKDTTEGVFANSNVYQSLRLLFEEAAAFGTGVMIVEEDDDEIIHCTTLTAGEYAISNGGDGRVNSLARTIYKTTAEIVSEFGYNECTDAIKEEYDNGRYDEFHKIYHVIMPNLEKKSGIDTAQGKDFLSLYWLDGADKFLKEASYKRNPIVALRWSRTTSTDIYGVGIGTRILGDMRQLTKLEKDKCLMIDLLAFPPMQVNASVQGKINLNPKGITRYVGNEPAVNPVQRGMMDLNDLQGSITQIEERINRAFYKDIFVMIMQATREKTAYEVDAMLAEKMLMLGPLYENIKYEVLIPVLSITVNSEISLGALPPPPDDINGDVDIEFHTMVSQSQKASSLSNINTFMSLVVGYSERFPDVLDNVIIDKIIVNSGERLGIDMSLLRDSKEVEQLRAQRAEASQQATALEQMQSAANINKTNAEAASMPGQNGNG